MTLKSWYVFVVFRAAGCISEAICIYDAGIAMVNGVYFLVDWKGK